MIWWIGWNYLNGWMWIWKFAIQSKWIGCEFHWNSIYQIFVHPYKKTIKLNKFSIFFFIKTCEVKNKSDVSGLYRVNNPRGSTLTAFPGKSRNSPPFLLLLCWLYWVDVLCFTYFIAFSFWLLKSQRTRIFFFLFHFECI